MESLCSSGRRDYSFCTSTDVGRSSDHKEESEKCQTSSGKLADRDEGMCQLLESGTGI